MRFLLRTCQLRGSVRALFAGRGFSVGVREVRHFVFEGLRPAESLLDCIMWIGVGQREACFEARVDSPVRASFQFERTPEADLHRGRLTDATCIQRAERSLFLADSVRLVESASQDARPTRRDGTGFRSVEHARAERHHRGVAPFTAVDRTRNHGAGLRIVQLDYERHFAG